MRTRTLDNGLLVVAEELRHAPVVAFSVWYRVGSRNEVPGITGISHWVEHMMFKGTPKFGKGALDRLVGARGGEWNGFTTEDFTVYYEVLPSEHLRLAAEIEADRMVNSVFEPQEVESERSVIVSEREGAENHPIFWLAEAVEAACWTVHPYRQGVIGAKCDLRAISREDLYAHYRSYYAPDNAAVVAAGDFTTEELFSLVEEHFGHIPRGAPRRPLRSVEPRQEGPRRVTVCRPGPARYLLAMHHVPEAAHPDIPALLVLAATLSGARSPIGWRGREMGRSSRLYRRLVQGGLAIRVDAEVALRADPGVLQVLATAAPGVELARLEEALASELRDVGSQGVGAVELSTAKRQLEAQIAYSRAGALGHAEWLGLFGTVGGLELSESIGPAISAVSREDVQRVAAAYLEPGNSTVGLFLPAGGGCRGQAGDGAPEASAGAAPLAGGSRRQFRAPRRAVHAGGGPGAPPGRGADKSLPLPGSRDIVRRVLPSGFTILSCRNRAADYVETLLRVRAGSRWDPEQLGGLGEFVARGVLQGTSRRGFDEYSEALDRIGASLSARCGPDAVLFRGSCLAGDLPAFAGLLGEALAGAAFRPEDMERLRAELLTRIEERDQDTAMLARRLALELTFPPGHPYGRPALGLTESVERVAIPDLVAFHAAHYSPAGALLTAVGPMDPDEICDALAECFQGWQGAAAGNARRANVLPGSPADTARTKDGGRTPEGRMWPGPSTEVELPGKTQTDLAIALPALSRRDPDFEGFQVLDLILGSFGLGGRIGRRVRDELGLAYYCLSAVSEREEDGPWLLQAGVNRTNVELALKTIREELDRVRTRPVSREELGDAVGFARGSLVLQLESPAGLAHWLMRLEAYGLGLDYLTAYPGRLEALTPEALLPLALRVFNQERAALAVVGPPHLQEGSPS